MTRDAEILKHIIGAKEAFGCKCGKFAGAVTVQVIRSAIASILSDVKTAG